jgi:HNH endonuclease/AP2 domain
MLTQQELKSVLHYDEETGLWTWLQSTSFRVRVGAAAGYRRSDGYLCIRLNTKLYLAHRLAWLYVRGHWPTANIDHVDGDKSNTRFGNLRSATQAQNTYNQRLKAKNTSGFKGAHWDISRNKWVAYITANRKRKHLGYFATAEDAHQAYCAAAKSLHGEFARTS